MSLQTIMAIARDLAVNCGPRAAVMASELARDLARAEDAEAAEFWFHVAWVIDTLQDEAAAFPVMRAVPAIPARLDGPADPPV